MQQFTGGVQQPCYYSTHCTHCEIVRGWLLVMVDHTLPGIRNLRTFSWGRKHLRTKWFSHTVINLVLSPHPLRFSRQLDQRYQIPCWGCCEFMWSLVVQLQLIVFLLAEGTMIKACSRVLWLQADTPQNFDGEIITVREVLSRLLILGPRQSHISVLYRSRHLLRSMRL